MWIAVETALPDPKKPWQKYLVAVVAQGGWKSVEIAEFYKAVEKDEEFLEKCEEYWEIQTMETPIIPFRVTHWMEMPLHPLEAGNGDV